MSGRIHLNHTNRCFICFDFKYQDYWNKVSVDWLKMKVKKEKV